MSLFLLAVLACAPIYAAPEQARAVARALWKKDHAIGMRRSQLNRACCFIDEIASKRPWQRVFSKKETGLPCDIERTVEPKGFMLTHLQGPFAKLGSGIHKVVMKALFYGPKPRLVAECIADESCAHEVEILKQLQGCRGIVPMLGYAVHPDNTYTIYLEYFRTGSLIKAIEDGVRFSTKQKLAIATDVLSGLHSLHERRLVHRDLHPGNILLRRCPSGLHAALIDFDKTIDPKNATDQDIPQAPKDEKPAGGPHPTVFHHRSVCRRHLCHGVYFLLFGMGEEGSSVGKTLRRPRPLRIHLRKESHDVQADRTALRRPLNRKRSEPFSKESPAARL